MTAANLNWHYVASPDDPSWNVKGTRLAQAVYGFQSRFAIVEIRAYDPANRWAVEYGIADADTVSDADVKAGKRPAIVRVFPTCEQCIAAIDRATAKLQAEYDAQEEP